ncbi:1687_t:CDS:1, partial [Acaulospora morrowiae]
DNSDPIRTIKVGCVLPTKGADIKSMIHQSAVLATQSSKIVLWGESALDLRREEVKTLLELASNETKKHKYFLGLTYFMPSETSDKKKNMFTLIGPDGEKIFDYQKTHPVPLAESRTVESGPGGQLPIANIVMPKQKNQTQLSLNVSAAICLDMDFPELITTASAVNLFLQPAQTWRSHIGLQHLRMASVRAIENGFWVLRCDGGGASGLIDPLGRIRNVQVSSRADRYQLLNWDLPLSDEKIHTIYASWGEYTVWGCLGVLFLLKLCKPLIWKNGPIFMNEEWQKGVEMWTNAKSWVGRKYEDTFRHVEHEEYLDA